MAEARNGRPAVQKFADHEIITPVNRLEKAMAKVMLPDDDPLSRAQAALAQLSRDFRDWMIEECDRLDAARHAVKEHGFNKNTFDELFHAAHDVRGGAGTYGFALAAGAAASLCRVLEHSPDGTRIPLAIVDQHVNAVRAIVREYPRPDIEEIATALIIKLRQVSEDFLVHENRHRPGYLDGFLSPPLVPNGGG